MFAYLVEIQAMHDFGNVVARHVILGKSEHLAKTEAECWGECECSSQKAALDIDEPENADFTGFRYDIREVSWHFTDDTVLQY